MAAPKKIAQKVYKRDNYTCVDCGFVGVPGLGPNKLQAHHVVPFRQGGTHELSNLITVCGKCHIKRDRQYWDECRNAAWAKQAEWAKKSPGEKTNHLRQVEAKRIEKNGYGWGIALPRN